MSRKSARELLFKMVFETLFIEPSQTDSYDKFIKDETIEEDNKAFISENFSAIIKNNEDLMKLLYYTDKDPLSQPNLTNEQKMEYVYKKLVKFVPRVGPREVENPIVSIRMVSGREDASNN